MIRYIYKFTITDNHDCPEEKLDNSDNDDGDDDEDDDDDDDDDIWSPLPTRAYLELFFVVFAAAFLCDLHTTTQVRYRLTTTWLLHILRLRGCLPFKVK